MEVWKIMFLSKWVICRFHRNLMLIFQGVWKERSLLQVLMQQSDVLDICYLQTHVSTKRDGCWTWGEVDSSRFPNENPSCFWIFVCVKPLPVVLTCTPEKSPKGELTYVTVQESNIQHLPSTGRIIPGLISHETAIWKGKVAPGLGNGNKPWLLITYPSHGMIL